MTFFTLEEILDLHQLNLERFGGSSGIRDQGALESALMAPVNRENYEQSDAIGCAAAYGFHLCQAHAFVDGNKRIAAVACEGFLRLEGFDLKASDHELIAVFLAIASSEMSRDQFQEFLRERTTPL